MRVTGTEVLALTPDEAWKRISDVETLGAALPSVQAVNVETADRFTAAFRPTTGLGSTPVRMTFTVTDRQAPAGSRSRAAAARPTRPSTSGATSRSPRTDRAPRCRGPSTPRCSACCGR
jgi:hypothetical protein